MRLETNLFRRRREAMRKILLSLLLVGLLAMPALSQNQCSTGQCPVGQAAEQPAQQPYPALVVTEFGAPGQSERTVGSGVIVAADGKMATVLTCAHGYKTLMKVVVIIQGGQRYRADIVGVDAVQDVMLLEIADPGIAPHPIAATEPARGERVYICGFVGGSLSAYAGSWGTVKQWVSPKVRGRSTFIETTCVSKNGQSGGPILNSRGQVVGIITGNRKGAIGPCLPRVRKVLKFLLPPYPNRPGVIVPKPRPRRAPVKPKRPRAAASEQLVKVVFSPKPLQHDISALLARIDKLETQIAALQLRPGIPGLRGPTGPAGKVGTAGRDGKDASLQPIPLDDLAAEVLGRLPPIYMQVIRNGKVVKLKAIPLGGTLPPIHVQVIRNGKVIENADVPLGGTLPLRLISVR